MKPLLVFLLLWLPLAAQEPAAKPAAGTSEVTQAPPAADQAKPEAKPADSSAPAAEQAFTGSVTLGYRWNGDIRGDRDVYRSIVNLGEGPRLVDLDLSIVKATRLFDRLDLRGANWGGDPYNNAYLAVRKDKWYRFSADYRNIAYFNNLPSFANPVLQNGYLLSQRSYDTHRRLANFDLELLPGNWIVPYFSYSRSAAEGNGVVDFQITGNEYPVRNVISDRSNNFRGGLRLEKPRWHASLEEGRITFGDDQLAYTNDSNLGNRTTPYLGQALLLSSLTQSYAVTGSSLYSQALFTASPWSWVDLRGTLLYSQPESKIVYDQRDQGLLVAPSTVDFANSQQSLITAGGATLPRTSGDVAFEVRPFSRLRVLGSWMTTRFHVSSSALLLDTLLSGATSATTTTTTTTTQSQLGDRNDYSYNQEQVDVLYDLTRKITLRAGQRFVWGESSVRANMFITPDPQETAELRQNVGLFGATVRPTQSISANVDLEAASGDRAYFRTSLENYQRARMRFKYQWKPSVQFAFNSWETHGTNPAAGINYDYAYYANALSASWRPNGGKRFGFTGEYMYSQLRSDLSYLEPETLARVASLYREHGHTGSGLMDLVLPSIGGQAPGTLSFGGSMFSVGGTRPTEYFQPMGRLTIPVQKNLQALAEWRWFGYSEDVYGMEGFRDHQLLIGLRLSH